MFSFAFPPFLDHVEHAVHGIRKSFARHGADRKYLALLRAGQFLHGHHLGNLLRRQRIWQILLVGQDKRGQATRVVLTLHQAQQLYPGLFKPLGIGGVDDIDNSISGSATKTKYVSVGI